jgi:tRNA 2-thiouridine synthesizing protein A
VRGDPVHGDAAAPREAATVVDARGLRCPLPVIRLAQAAQGRSAGWLLELWATDPAARADVPAWCRMRGHALVQVIEATGDEATGTDAGHTAYRVRLTGHRR